MSHNGQAEKLAERFGRLAEQFERVRADGVETEAEYHGLAAEALKALWALRESGSAALDWEAVGGLLVEPRALDIAPASYAAFLWDGLLQAIHRFDGRGWPRVFDTARELHRDDEQGIVATQGRAVPAAIRCRVSAELCRPLAKHLTGATAAILPTEAMTAVKFWQWLKTHEVKVCDTRTIRTWRKKAGVPARENKVSEFEPAELKAMLVEALKVSSPIAKDIREHLHFHG